MKGEKGLDITPLFDTIIKHCDPFPDLDDEPLQLQISSLAYDDYIGRLGIGRITKGVLREGQTVGVAQGEGQLRQKKSIRSSYIGACREPRCRKQGAVIL